MTSTKQGPKAGVSGTVSWAHRLRRGAAIIALMVLGGLPGTAAAQPCGGRMQDLGTLGGATSQAKAVSADGSIVVGWAYNAAGQQRAFRWTAAGGMQDLGTLGGTQASAWGVSAEGSVVVGVARNAAGQERAFRWTSGGGMVDLGTLGGATSYAYGVSADGSVVVGSSTVDNVPFWVNQRAFRWTFGGGMQELERYVNQAQLRGNAGAHAVSGNGSTVVGWSDNVVPVEPHEYAPRAMLWQTGQPVLKLGVLGNGGLFYDTSSMAMGLSIDGSIVVGWSHDLQFRVNAFVWTSQSSHMVEIPLGAYESGATGVSSSGSSYVVVGATKSASGQYEAFRWSLADGTEYLGALGGLESYATAISTNGDVIVGWAQNAAGQQRAFRWSYPMDSDGDGIPDDWEINGVPYVDANGNCQRYPLPGANHMRKDIFIEIDVMTGVPFSESSLAAVRAAFAAAPVDNPDGSTGVTLHTIVDETNVPHVAAVTDSLMTHYRDTWFGTNAERAHSDAAALLEAKGKVFRHCMFFDQMFSNDGTDLAGKSGGIHSDHFAVSLGGTPFDAAKIERFLGSTFMHELGHALGLRHGGSNNVLYKPNYVSVMNYNFDAIQVPSGNQWIDAPLDYSRGVFIPLHESNLNEIIGVPTIAAANYIVPHTYQDAQNATHLAWVLLGGQPHDWNQNGPPNVYEPSVSVDLNRMPAGNPLGLRATAPSPGETLTDFNDWAAIQYIPPTMRQRGDCEDCDDGCLLSVELVEWHEENMPPLPPVPNACPADLTGDGILDFFDVQLFLNLYASGDLAADLTGDGILDFFDVQAFLNLYAAGCP